MPVFDHLPAQYFLASRAARDGINSAIKNVVSARADDGHVAESNYIWINARPVKRPTLSRSLARRACNPITDVRPMTANLSPVSKERVRSISITRALSSIFAQLPLLSLERVAPPLFSAGPQSPPH